MSSAFALLVLFSSSSFIVGFHLCGDRVQNIALFTRAEGCGMEKKMPPCHKHESKPCCEDKTIVHDAQDFNGHTNQIIISAAHVIHLAPPVLLIAEIIPAPAFFFNHHRDYDPPLRETDVTVDLQVFII